MNTENIRLAIQEAKSRSSCIEYTVATVKPDGVRRRIGKELETNLLRDGLRTEICFSVSLDSESIIKLLPVLSRPSEFGDSWKVEVIKALQEGPNIAYLISGDDAVSKVLTIRNSIRQRHTDRNLYVERVVRNLLHASDSSAEALDEIDVLAEKIDYEKMLSYYAQMLLGTFSNSDWRYHHSKNIVSEAKRAIKEQQLPFEIDGDELIALCWLHHADKTQIDEATWLPIETRNKIIDVTAEYPSPLPRFRETGFLRFTHQIFPDR